MLHHRRIIFALIALSAANALADFHPGQDDHVIKDHYIVVMNHQHRRRSAQFQSTDASSSSDDLPSGMKVKHTYDFEHDEEPLVGYSAHMDADTLQQVLSRDDVAYVERDRTVYALGVQKDAPWGVARIAHRDRPSRWSGESRRYPYVDSAGEGVDVYVIDTGINIQHEDFGGRATWGVTIPPGDKDEDGNGHGTHVAGTIVGTQYGVAKKAQVHAVKVLRSDGSGSLSDVIKGIEWVIKRHQKGRKAVANMSLGGGKTRVLDRAVNQAVKNGIHFAVAAGNDYRDACDYSPAGADLAVTVGATDVMDEMTSFSNFGSCVDIFAPGRDITSAWIGSKTATKTISGTSMASPHVAGVMTLMLGEQDYTPKELKKAMLKEATKDVVGKLKGASPNRLLYSMPPKRAA